MMNQQKILGAIVLILIFFGQYEFVFQNVQWNAANLILLKTLTVSTVNLLDDKNYAINIYEDHISDHSAMLRQLLIAHGAEFEISMPIAVRRLYLHRLFTDFPEQFLWSIASAGSRTDIGLQAFHANPSGRIGTDMDFCATTIGDKVVFADLARKNSVPLVKPIAQSDGEEMLLVHSSAPITSTVCIPRDGIYEISVGALNSAPAPIDIAVYWDGWLVGILRYSHGDDSFELRSLRFISPQGIHELSIQLANDLFDPETSVDRNAIIGHFVIESVTDRVSK